MSFSVAAGETLGLVGESGSGKSMTCLSLVRLVPRPAARIVGGQVLLDGDDLLAKTEAEMQQIRGRQDRDDPAGPDELAQPGVLRRHAGARAARACITACAAAR